MLQIAAQPPATAVPVWYGDCFRTALRRVAALLNSREPYVRCARADLRLHDADLDSLFECNRWDEHVIQFHVGDKDPFTALDDGSAPSTSSIATSTSRRVATIGWRSSSCQRHSSNGAIGACGGRRAWPRSWSSTGSAAASMHLSSCATAPLTIWSRTSGTTLPTEPSKASPPSNYHQFRGPAREDSDFEADNVANILLVRAYGLPVLSRGVVGASNAARIEALFRRNRCNLIFAERAQHRRTDRANMGIEERWSEMEWRFCRAVANALSIRLIGMGLAVPSLRIFFNGDLKTADGGARRWREGTVVVEIAGRRIDTGVPPYLPDDELRSETASAEGDVSDHARPSRDDPFPAIEARSRDRTERRRCLWRPDA